MSTDHPILMTGEMVCATLELRKKKTRRVITNLYNGGWCLDPEEPQDRETTLSLCPYGRAGDFLWVRETWLELNQWHYDETKPFPQNKIAYRAGISADGDAIRTEYGYKWKPSIFMPRWASRLRLQIISVGVQQLQCITDEGAIAEGIQIKSKPQPEQARELFRSLWSRLNDKRGFTWHMNPWVYVIEYRMVSEPCPSN